MKDCLLAKMEKDITTTSNKTEPGNNIAWLFLIYDIFITIMLQIVKKKIIYDIIEKRRKR